jgi:hypothetical protein
VISAQRPYVPLVALALVVVAVGVVVASLLIHGAKPQSLPAAGARPALVSQAQLERLAAVTDYPVYWAGPKKGYSYELTRTSGGRIYIRYLPQGVSAGDPRADFLVVGTYAQPGSFAYLTHASSNADAVSLDLTGGGIAVYNPARPTSVYFTFPRTRYQVEVYDPSGKTARSLVLAGTIAPIR